MEDKLTKCSCGGIFNVHVSKVEFPKPAATERTKKGKIFHWFTEGQVEHFAVQMVHSDRISRDLEIMELTMLLGEIRMILVEFGTDRDLIEAIKTMKNNSDISKN